MFKIAAVACAMAGAGALPGNAAARVTVWHVASYSFSYEESAQSSQPVCEGREFSRTDGWDLRSETATLTMSGFTKPQALPLPGPPGVISYQRAARGPSTFTKPFGGTAVVHRSISKEFLQCRDWSQVDSSCTNPRTIDFGYQREYEIGAIKVATKRRRSRVTVRVTGWTGEFGDPFDLLACRSDPFGLALGPPTTGHPSESTLRKTLPLKIFTHRTTTIALNRTLKPPEDAAKRYIPLSTVKLSARITLKRSVSDAFCGPPPRPPDRLFVCTAQF